MNIKAERIEQLIQIVNRNLQLIYSGSGECVTPLELRKLRKVDTGVFGHDKFAFEMVHFIKSNDEHTSNNKPSDNNQMSFIWDKNFSLGLENLLVECAIVADDIERDCFVSRVYCWFTEKLAERREIPKAASRMRGQQFDDLKSSLQNMGADANHTLKALDKYTASAHMGGGGDVEEKQPHVDGMVEDRDVPPFVVPPKPSKYGSRNIPTYVKHGFPDVLRPKIDYTSFLPKIPSADNNYGLVYNKPESEAEQKMNELWLAKRRQEAFEWKTQQHLSLVLDRLALHKSRLESDSLRRQESNSLLVDLKSNDMRNNTHNSHDRPASAPGDISRTRFAPLSRRPRSGRRGMSKRNAKSMTQLHESDDHSLGSRSPERPDDLSSPDRSPERPSDFDSSIVLRAPDGSVEEAVIPKAAREPVLKKKDIMPMRFGMSMPTTYSKSMLERNEYYMQLSDSDDDDKPDKVPRGTALTAKGGKEPDAKGVGGVTFKREKPVMRERPLSARLFRSVATNDPEFKVLYRYSNYRRMPLTTQQESWLEEKEAGRAKRAGELATKLLEETAAKGDKKGGKKEEKKEEKKDAKKKEEKVVEAAPEKPKSRYKSATHFMNENFPNFDGDDEKLETQGPMRTMQLVECARVLNSCSDYGVSISSGALRKALVIPQDRPEAICLESMRETNIEGLMTNPIPQEFWKKVSFSAGGKKKGKKGKKK